MNISINSKNDLLTAYVLVHALGKIQQTPKVKHQIATLKYFIRKYNRNGTPEYPRAIKGDYDSCILLDKLPANISNKTEAVNYFERNCYVPVPYSTYDCTGQAFTTRFKVFQRHGAWYVYHFMARDV